MTFPVIERRLDEVVGSTPDGAYFRVNGDTAQIIIVGPTRHTPAEYLFALWGLLDWPNAYIRSLGALEIVAGVEAAAVMRGRGFWTIDVDRGLPCQV